MISLTYYQAAALGLIFALALMMAVYYRLKSEQLKRDVTNFKTWIRKNHRLQEPSEVQPTSAES
jgi:hypothetical protein